MGLVTHDLGSLQTVALKLRNHAASGREKRSTYSLPADSQHVPKFYSA